MTTSSPDAERKIILQVCKTKGSEFAVESYMKIQPLHRALAKWPLPETEWFVWGQAIISSFPTGQGTESGSCSGSPGHSVSSLVWGLGTACIEFLEKK